MITVKINQEERQLHAANEQWINQQINLRRRDGQVVCVGVTVRTDRLSVALTTPTCGGTGGGRPPTAEEKRILDLWHHRGLDRPDFTGGSLVAFLKQLVDLT